MKYRMFTNWYNGNKFAFNIDYVICIEEISGEAPGTIITLAKKMEDGFSIFRVREDFDTVLSRLNIIAE